MALKSIAQTFITNGDYVPAKASAFLRNAGDSKSAFVLPSVIDATNYREIKQGKLFLILDDDAESTGSGCLSVISSSILTAEDADCPTITYPIQSDNDGKYYLYARIKGTGTVIVYINGFEYTTIVGNSSSWHWIATSIIVPDQTSHEMKLRFIDVGVKLDKIILSPVLSPPTGEGPSYTQSPYITLHGRLARVVSGLPITYFQTQSSINSYDTLTKEGWYNFDLTIFDGYETLPETDFAFVLTASGASSSHYAVWDEANEVTNSTAYSTSFGTWIIDTLSSMAIKVYAEFVGHDEYGCSITTPGATLENEVFNDFELVEINPRHQNTITIDDTLGGNDIQLDVSEKLITLIVDQSGSNSWNDSTGARHQFTAGVLDAIEIKYPSDVRFNLLKLNGEPAFSFFISLTSRIDTNSPSDIIKESFRGKPENFAGFRVVRNPDRYPQTPIDGEIITDGYALASLDVDLDQNKQYYYTVYTYDHFDRFSYGVQIPAKTNTKDVPRGIPTFEVSVLKGLDLARDENFLAQWNMDEGSGDYIYDFSDSNVTLTLDNTRWLGEYDAPTGRYGIRFNGFSSTATSLETSAMSFGMNDSFTVMGYVYPFSTNANSCIVARSDVDKFNWSIIQDGLTLKLKLGGETASCSIPFEEEEWQRFAVTYSNGVVNFYINGTLANSTTITFNLTQPNTDDMRLNVGFDPSGNQTARYFGKISHISVHGIARDLSFISGATPKVRYTELGNPPGKIPPDNGDRLVVANFDVPDDFNYNTIRIVRNHFRMPYHESDGDIVLEIEANAGNQSYGLPNNYDIDSSYWFRIFTKNIFDNWCPITDSLGYEVKIPDQDRPHIIVYVHLAGATEMNPGPGIGDCAAPVMEVNRAGNQKVHIKWTVPSTPCTLVKIYHRTDKYVAYNNGTKWIVNPNSIPTEFAIPIFAGPASVGEFVDRNKENKQSNFYTIVFSDRLGKHSQLVNLSPIVPRETADDSGIPLLEALNVSYEIADYDRIKIAWQSPVIISSNTSGWLDDIFYVYGAICDLYGNPLPIDFPEEFKVRTAISGSQQTGVEDVFNGGASQNESIERIPKASFSVNAGGLIIGNVRLRNSPLFSVLESLSLTISAEYKYSENFTWKLPLSSISFRAPLEMKIVNRDSSYLPTSDFTRPACENLYESGGSNVPRSGARMRVNGAYIRRKQNFFARAIFTYKGLPVRNAKVSAKSYDAVDGPCGIYVKSLDTVSKTLKFGTSSFPIQVSQIPIIDDNGYDTGVVETASYADIPLIVPHLPQSGRIYVRVNANSFQSIKRMNIYFPTILRINLTSASPIGNGNDVREQFANVWLVDPDHPRDESKITIAPDLSVIKWTLSNGSRKVPFYSTDNVPLTNGVYSYTRSGTARYVFFGPAKSGSEGEYRLTVSTTVNGLFASREASLEIKIPGIGRFEHHIPEPTAPRIFCEMDECINYLWADGEDWVKMRVFRNAIDPDKTLIANEQAKYADKFRECSPVMYPLPAGSVINVAAPGYEIIWGPVTEIENNVTGTRSLNTQGAFNALNSADITLSRDNYTAIYFRKDAEIKSRGCRPTNAINCCGFDMAARICNDPNVIGDDTGIIVSTKINLAGKPIVIYGGGPVGDDNTSRPPTVLVPKEPLAFNLVGTFVNGELVEEVVVDGTTMNQFIFEISYRNRPVPTGVPIDVFLTVVLDGQKVTKIGDIDIYTYFNIPKTTYSYTSAVYPGTDVIGSYSFCGFTMNPIPTNKNISLGFGVSTTYNGRITFEGSSSSSGGL